MTARISTWLTIVRLGLVQAALGGTVAFCTYTLNRIMKVEFMFPAIVPGVMVAWHYALQVLRPRLGYASDVGGRRTPWIVGGMALMATGATVATAATCLLAMAPITGVALAALGFTAMGIGVAAAGTSNLVLLAKQVDERHRAAGAAIVWLMMIVGIIVTAGIAGRLLEPFSLPRLMEVGAGVAGVSLFVALAAVWRLEPAGPPVSGVCVATPRRAVPGNFRRTLRDVWADPQARLFTLFVFVAMLAFNAQELVLEPFAGSVFQLTPGASTRLIGVQHQGVLAGMLLFGAVAGVARGTRYAAMRTWTVGGCLASAVLIGCLAGSSLVGPRFPLWPCVAALGVANGAFTVAAVGSMMQLAAVRRGSEGVRMGMWGAAQAIASALGGLVGTGMSDVAEILLGTPRYAYAVVFALEGLLFVVAAQLATGIVGNSAEASRPLTFSRRVSMAGGNPEPRR